MATSGENEGVVTVYTYCTEPVYPFGFDLICGVEGDVDVRIDRDDNKAVFTCDNGHVNYTTREHLDIA